MEKTLQALPVITDGLAPKGGLKAAVGKDIKEQAVAKFLDGFELTEKGRYVRAVAEVDGTIAYVAVSVTVTNDAEKLFAAPAAKATANAETDTEVPSLFV